MQRIFAAIGIAAFVIGCDFPAAEEISVEPPVVVDQQPVQPANEDTTKPPVVSQFGSIEEGLAALAQATDAHQKEQQQAAYGWLIKQGEAAVPAVAAAMNDAARSIAARRMACHVLAQLGPPAAPALLEATASGDPSLKLKAVESLAAVQPPQKEIVERLIALMDDPSEQVQATAMRSLGYIGPPAKAAADKLQALRNNVDANETLRGEADRALKRVRPIRTFED